MTWRTIFLPVGDTAIAEFVPLLEQNNKWKHLDIPCWSFRALEIIFSFLLSSYAWLRLWWAGLFKYIFMPVAFYIAVFFSRKSPGFNREVFVDFIAAQIKTLSFLAYIIKIYQVCCCQCFTVYQICTTVQRNFTFCLKSWAKGHRWNVINIHEAALIHFRHRIPAYTWVTHIRTHAGVHMASKPHTKRHTICTGKMKLLRLMLQSKIMAYMTKHTSTAARVIMLSAVSVRSHLCSLTSVFTHICVRSHLCSLQLICWAKVTQEECLPEPCCITIICSTGTMSSFTQLKIGIFSLFYETDCWLFIITLCHSTSPNGPTVLGSGWSCYRMEQFLAFPEKTGSMSRDTLVYVDNKTVFHLGV